jgi:hypothetical protein
MTCLDRNFFSRTISSVVLNWSIVYVSNELSKMKLRNIPMVESFIGHWFSSYVGYFIAIMIIINESITPKSLWIHLSTDKWWKEWSSKFENWSKIISICVKILKFLRTNVDDWSFFY